MTTELEKQFFDTFGIEPEYKTCIFEYCKNKKENDCENCNDREWHYPEITDRILLELICILTKLQAIEKDYYRLHFCTYKTIKDQVLGDCICEKEFVQHQVQALFKE